MSSIILSNISRISLFSFSDFPSFAFPFKLDIYKFPDNFKISKNLFVLIKENSNVS